jgi:phage I-like protein
MHKQSIVLSAQLIELSGNPPTEIKLLPAGKFRAKDGRPKGLDAWTMDDTGATLILNSATNQKDRFLIDYDHQTLHAKTNGAPAPAAGWFSSLEWRKGLGLFATDVQWTEKAKQAIQAKEYRYISPVIHADTETGHVMSILMAAICNYPALDGLNDLAAAHFNLFQTSENPMNKEHLTALGLAEGADDSAILSAINALKERAAQVETLTAQVAELGTPDPAKFVPVEALTAMQTELAALSATVKQDNINKLIEPALADGRLLPALKQWAENYGKADYEGLAAFLTLAQPISALTRTQTGGIPPVPGLNALTAEERFAAKSLGLTDEEMINSREAA